MRTSILVLALGASVVVGAQVKGSGVISGKGTPAAGSVVATASRTGLVANVAQTTLYTVPAGQGGMYIVSCYAVVTTAATTSSTLPNCKAVNWTDPDSGFAGGAISITSNSASNTVGTFVEGVHVLNAAAGTAIPWTTANFASVGATGMAYAIHVKLQYLGPG